MPIGRKRDDQSSDQPPGDEVDTIIPSAVQKATAFQQLVKLLGARAEIEEQGTRSFSEDAFMNIVDAESETDMWADRGGNPGARDIVGMQILPKELYVRISSSEDISSDFVDSSTDKKLYFDVLAQRLDSPVWGETAGAFPHIKQGDDFTFNTGASQVVARLLWLERHDLLGKRQVKVTSVRTARGFHVLKLNLAAPPDSSEPLPF